MREFSKIYDNLWDSEKFNALDSDDAKLLYFYLSTSKHKNSSGCYDLRPGYATEDLKWGQERYRNALERLCKVNLIEFDEAKNTVLIGNWVTFNEPTNAKHALGILTSLKSASSVKLKSKRAQEFNVVIREKSQHLDKQVGSSLERLCKELIEAFGSLSPLDKTKTKIKDEIGGSSEKSQGQAKGDSQTPSFEEIEKALRKAAGWENEPAPGLQVVGSIIELLNQGASLELDVLPVVRAHAQRVQTRTNWNYFIKPIQQSMASRSSAAASVSSVSVDLAAKKAAAEAVLRGGGG